MSVTDTEKDGDRMLWSQLGIFCLSLQWLALAFNHRNDPGALAPSIGEMTHNIILSYFRDASCVGIVTEINPDIVDYIPESLFRFHIQVGGTGKDSSVSNLEETDTLNYASLNNETLKFEELLIDSLNAGCPVYVIQVSNPKAVIHCFARASRRAMFRRNRQYLYLPILKAGNNISDYSGMKAEDIFTMKEMDYMPDVVLARVAPNMNRHKANDVEVDYLYKSCDNILPRPSTFCRRNDSKQRKCNGKNSSKVAGPASSEFKIELLTQRFTGSEISKTLLLDVWLPVADGCNEGFLKSADLFPDKTRDVKGKELTIVTWHYPPFVILDFNATPPLYDGIEFRVVEEFMRHINSTFRQVSFLAVKYFSASSCEVECHSRVMTRKGDKLWLPAAE